MKLKKNHEFKNVYKNGAYAAGKLLVVYVLKNNKNENYFGVSVGKKVGKSVARSRVTRLIRETVRLNADKLKKGYDIVVLARAGSAEAGFFDINEAFIKQAARHRLFNENGFRESGAYKKGTDFPSKGL